jgi:hypothetical protein
VRFHLVQNLTSLFPPPAELQNAAGPWVVLRRGKSLNATYSFAKGIARGFWQNGGKFGRLIFTLLAF